MLSASQQLEIDPDKRVPTIPQPGNGVKPKAGSSTPGGLHNRHSGAFKPAGNYATQQKARRQHGLQAARPVIHETLTSPKQQDNPRSRPHDRSAENLSCAPASATCPWCEKQLYTVDALAAGEAFWHQECLERLIIAAAELPLRALTWANPETILLIVPADAGTTADF